MEKSVKKFRQFIFLKDVFYLALSAFGGPQAHIAMMFERLVDRHRYLSEEELIELNALCQILPGPTSTQTIVAVGYKHGGSLLAFMTLLVWVLPAGLLMTLTGIFIIHFEEQGVDISFTKYIQPMAIAFIAFAGMKIARKVVKSKSGWFLLVASAIGGYGLSVVLAGEVFVAILYPIILILGGVFTSFKYKKQEKIEGNDQKISIPWKYLWLYISVFVLAVGLGNVFSSRIILLFENFYRNGSLIFGGGQVLIPLLKVQFVDYKEYLTNEEFLSGLGFVQAVPGPVFSLAGYIGALSMKGSLSSMFFGGIVSLAGVFLPGVFLIFFVYRFWEELKVYRPVRASLEGISAAGAGLVLAAVLLLAQSLNLSVQTNIGLTNIGIIVVTYLLLEWKKIPAPFLILAGLLAGFLIK